jgi:hypothetical protein
LSNLIIDLISDYQAAVEKVMFAFKAEYNRSDLLTACRSDKIIPKTGQLEKYGIVEYSFHGIGIHSTFTDNTTVDFDFAFFPEQRNDGFDLWRLSEFVNSQPGNYRQYIDKAKLEADFNELINKGIIINPPILDSTPLYFLK